MTDYTFFRSSRGNLSAEQFAMVDSFFFFFARDRWIFLFNKFCRDPKIGKHRISMAMERRRFSLHY